MRILVVDDEKMIREVARRFLEMYGHVVETAKDGKVALELLEADGFNFDAVVTDQDMPEMSGTELLKNIRRLVKDHLPVFCTTGQSDPGTIEHLRTLGFDAVLPKPYYPKDLKAILDNIPAA